MPALKLARPVRGLARLQPLLIGLATAAVILVGVYFLDQAEQSRYRERVRAGVFDRLAAMRARIEGYLHSKTFIARGLALHTQQNPHLTLEDFNRYAQGAMEGQPGVRYLGLLKGTRVAYAYPPEGAEPLMGYDLLDNDEQRETTLNLIETGKTIIAGPVEAIPGLRSFVNETPIYLPAKDKASPRGEFWGIAALLIDVDYLLSPAGVIGDSHELRVCLMGKDGMGREGDIFHGDPNVFRPKSGPVEVEVLIPNGKWILAGVPINGWPAAAPGSWGWRVGGVCLAVIAALFLGLFAWTPHRLRQLVHDRTAALRETEKKYRGIFENAQEGVFQCSPDGTILSANPALARTLGYPDAADFIRDARRIDRDLILDEEPRLEFRRMLGQSAVTDFEVRLLRRDGVPIWARINARSIVDASGGFTHAEGTIVDVTESKRALEALRLSRAELREKADSLATANSIADSLYRTLNFKTVVERALHAIAAYTRAPAVAIFSVTEDGNHVRALRSRGLEKLQDVNGGRATLQTSLTGLAITRKELVIADDIANDPRVSPELHEALMRAGFVGLVCVPLLYQDQALGAIDLFFKEPSILGPIERETLMAIGKTIALAMDNSSRVAQIEEEVRERRRAEEELVESEARYRLVSELTSDYAYSAQMNAQGRVSLDWITEAYWRITGYTQEELSRSTNWKSLIHPEDKPILKERFKRLARLESVTSEARIITKKGEIRWIRDIAQPARSPSGDTVRIYGAGKDITERKRDEEEKSALEARLRHSQKMEAIGTLAGGVAHDFNNLLTGILGYANLLKLEADPGSSTFKAADVIEKAAERASHLTKQLLGFARRGKLQNVPVDLHATILEVSGLLSRTLDKSITIERQFAETDLFVRGDPDQLQQVFLNLAVNARDAMPGGGELTFASCVRSLASEEAIRHTDAAPGDYAVVRVSDTGAGIPDDVRERIFEPFFTTKEHGKGTGMGLAMVYGIIKNHGGFIRVDSRAGVGASMRVFLPIERGAPEAKPAVKAAEPVRGQGRILVVDDEPIVRELARDTLVSLGYEVVTAAGGEEALEIYRVEWPRIDGALIDMVMPKMGARELFARMIEINPGLRAVLSTGYGRDSAAQEILDAGMVGFVQKPYHIAQLSEVIAQALRAETPNPARA